MNGNEKKFTRFSSKTKVPTDKFSHRQTYTFSTPLRAELVAALLLVGLRVTTVLTEAAVGEGDDFDAVVFFR